LKKMINKLLCIATFIVYSYTYSQTIHEISAPEEIENLNLNAGDTIILEDGMYDSDERISFLGTGTSDNPITFRPQTPGGVVFT